MLVDSTLIVSVLEVVSILGIFSILGVSYLTSSVLEISYLRASYLRISYLISFVLGISSALIIPSFPANFSLIYFHSTPSSSLSSLAEIFAKNDLSLCYALKIPPLISKHLEGSGTKVIIDLSNVTITRFSSKK